MRIALLVTGWTEFFGLPGALQRLFPGVEFRAIESYPGSLFHGFTSHSLPAPRNQVPTALDKLVAQAVMLADPAMPESWDLVVILEDLELANRSMPEVVCSEVRLAVERHLEGLGRNQPDADRLSAAVREKVSFHLAVPMIESWFFAAPTALSGLGLGKVAFHKKPGDSELFESTDQNYIAALPESCKLWCRNRRPKGDRPKWIGAKHERVLHPKGYLQWLKIDPEHKTCTSYREGNFGAGPVLAAIDWTSLLKDPESMTYVRALVEDLADGLGQSPSVSSWIGRTADLTRRDRLPDRQRLLRNL